MGRKKNPIGSDGTVMTCSICGSGEHFRLVCPRRPQDGSSQQGTYHAHLVTVPPPGYPSAPLGPLGDLIGVEVPPIVPHAQVYAGLPARLPEHEVIRNPTTRRDIPTIVESPAMTYTSQVSFEEADASAPFLFDAWATNRLSEYQRNFSSGRAHSHAAEHRHADRQTKHSSNNICDI